MARPRTEVEVVRDTYWEDPTVTNEEYGRLIEEAAEADDSRALELERGDHEE